MGKETATYQQLLDQYNKIKDTVCSDTNCKLNKRLLKLEVDFESAKLGLETGEDKKWLAERDILSIKEGPTGLQKKVDEKAQNFISNLEKIFNEIKENLSEKINAVDIQTDYIDSIGEMVDFNNEKTNEIQQKYDKVLKSNNINKRLAIFYSNDEEYVKPFITFLEKIFWPVVIITTILFLFKLFKGSYPTNKDKILNILFICFLYITPLFFGWFANTFNGKLGYKGYESTDVLDAKRYKNLA